MTSYTQFFSGTATVAGALVGLLFVALSVAPERLRGAHASIEHQASASVTFIYIMFSIGIARSWELLGLHGGGPLDLLSQSLGGRGPRPRGSAVRSAPPESQPDAE